MKDTTTTVFIGFGSNLGDRQRNILNAIALINTKAQTAVLRCSPIYTSKPLTGDSQPEYLNCIAEIETSLPPLQLLRELKDIERILGRGDADRWQSRVIDIDIIFYGDEVIHLPELSIPHRQAHLRSFVLDGVCRLQPDKKHPVLGRSCLCLQQRLGGGNFFVNKSEPILVELTGPIGVGKTTLAQALATHLNAEILREKYDENPFLPLVYQGRSDVSLDCELFFLENSISELRKENLVPGKVYIADYIFEKSTIYPRFWLNEADFEVFIERYLEVRGEIQTPTVVLDVFDTADNCIDRIHRRCRKYEQEIKPDFINKLSDEYEKMLKNWKASPVIRVDAAKYDFMNAECVKQIFEQVRHYLGYHL